MTRENKTETAQLLVRYYRLSSHMGENWKEFMEHEIISVNNTMLLVWKLNFLQLSCLVFLSKFDLTWLSFDSWSVGEGCGYIFMAIGLFEYRSSIVCICKGLDSSWDETDLLLQLKSGLYVKMYTKREQYMCVYCREVFNLSSKRMKQPSFDTSTIFYRWLCQVHPSTSIRHLSQLWSDRDVYFCELGCWFYWFFSDLIVWPWRVLDTGPHWGTAYWNSVVSQSLKNYEVEEAQEWV